MNKKYELPSATLLGDLREFMESDVWRDTKADIPVILGKDATGNVKITDLSKAPHMLIAGATGSGKTVFLNTLITSLLYRFSPDELKLILIDPKVVELGDWRPLPHLITPVVNDPTKVPGILRWAFNELEYRYRVMARVKAKNLLDFNARSQNPETAIDENGNPIPQKLPRLIIILDELSDMMRSNVRNVRKDVETLICRIAQKGRAAGIHLVISTQVLSKDVITGIIKANMPTRLAFQVSQECDSRLILDNSGAEKLLGKGDMLFNGPGGDTERIQGAMISDSEIRKIVDFVSVQTEQKVDSVVVAEDQEKDNCGDDGQDDFLDETANQIKVMIEAMRENAGDENAEQILEEMLKQQLQQLVVHVVEKQEEEKGKADEQEAPPDETISKYLQTGDDKDMRKALEVVLYEGKASTSYLQRRLGIGYNKACEIIDTLEQRGIVSAPLPGGHKRNILIQVNPDTSAENN